MIRQFGSWSTVFIIRYFIELFQNKIKDFVHFCHCIFLKYLNIVNCTYLLLKKIEFLSEVKI